MRGHSALQIQARHKAQEQLRQEIQGRLPAGPFELFSSFAFEELAPNKDDGRSTKYLKAAMLRDARYAVAGPRVVRLMGLQSNLRSIFDGGFNLLRAGIK